MDVQYSAGDTYQDPEGQQDQVAIASQDETMSQDQSMADNDSDQSLDDSSSVSDNSCVPDNHADVHVYETTFVALNNSGIRGGALLIQNANDLTIQIDATGMTPGEVHPQHIHGFTDGTISQLPTLAQDTDHDGFVELEEGLVTYGPILLNLTTNPDDSVHDHGTGGHDHTGNALFPSADENGNLHYVATFHFDPSDPNSASIFSSILPLDIKEIILHGENVAEGSGAGTPGEVNGTGGYIAVLPVAGGEIRDAGQHADALYAAFQNDAIYGDHSVSDFLLGHA